MHAPFDATTIIFAVLAIFVIWKLRSVLGTRTGTERPPTNPFEPPAPRDGTPGTPGQVVRLPGAVPPPAPNAEAVPAPPAAPRWTGWAEADTPVARGLDAIAAVDTAFSPGPFVEGATRAYEMVVAAFAAGDRTTLKSLLAPEVYASFEGAITAREQKGETAKTTIVSIGKVTIEDAHMDRRTALLTLRIPAQLISVTHDKAGTVIEGNAEQVADLAEIWTFARDTTSRDPNWQIAGTGSHA